MDKLTGPLLKPGPVDLHLALRSHLGHCYCFGEPAETTNSDSHNTHTICPLVASGLLLSVDSLHHKSKRPWPWCLMHSAGGSYMYLAAQTSQEGHIVCASEWSSWISGWFIVPSGRYLYILRCLSPSIRAPKFHTSWLKISTYRHSQAVCTCTSIVLNTINRSTASSCPTIPSFGI